MIVWRHRHILLTAYDHCLSMLSREQLKWTKQDDDIVEQFKRDLAAGKIKPMNFLDIKRQD